MPSGVSIIGREVGRRINLKLGYTWQGNKAIVALPVEDGHVPRVYRSFFTA